MLEKFGMLDCNPVDTPSDVNQKLFKGESSEKDENIPYQQAVGSLIYLAQGTRPDIAYAVNNASRFNNCYTSEHWGAVKRIFRYIRGTTGIQLRFKKQKDFGLHGFSDADWANDVDDRKSTTGHVFRRSGCAISWNSRRKQTVALSTTEAEYMALAAATQEAIWLRQFEEEFWQINSPITMYCDNRSAICLANNSVYSARSKHIDIRHHYVREKCNEEKIVVKHINTDFMAADGLTKALPKQKFVFCRNSFGLIDM